MERGKTAIAHSADLAVCQPLTVNEDLGALAYGDSADGDGGGYKITGLLARPELAQAGFGVLTAHPEPGEKIIMVVGETLEAGGGEDDDATLLDGEVS